ncbi:lactose-binding lectin l-2-like [Seriola aureovittata]|uniref:lactose-binding lectin l-2-like n=1 Tax=Seriola aureovittata TaxID=2871759 RepID=UPI0024BEFA73|nr:lactose-binding lectin l-2-like [Seriola aureovittata]
MILLFLLFGLALGAENPSDEHDVKLQQGNCTMSWFSFNGRCYKYMATPMTWADAELHCVSEEANLVSIHSLDEDNFVKAVIKNFSSTRQDSWIGLSDTQKEGRWMWSDGSAVNFLLWAPRQPDDKSGMEDCVHNNFMTDLKWNDRPCSLFSSFVCASRMSPATKIVVYNSTC